MIRRYIFVSLLHFLCIVLILILLYFFLPWYITSCYFWVANFILSVILAKLTLGIPKALINKNLQLDGKAVLITGCAKGIGNALAKHLDKKGCHVFASCRNSDSPGADDLRKSCSSRLKVFQLDVTKDESVQNAVDFVKNSLGERELWAVINNAGVQKGLFTEFSSMQDFKDCMETNAIGTVRVTQAFLPMLRKSKGRILNVTSLSVRVPLVFTPSYTMSKWAQAGFSACLRHEMAMWGIKVITIEPEIFETPMVNRESIMVRIDDTIASSDESVLEAYGEEFLKKFQHAMDTYFVSSNEMQKVLDDVERALSLKYPEHVYTVNRNVFTACAVKVFELCPVMYQTAIYMLCGYIAGMRKPKATSKC